MYYDADLKTGKDLDPNYWILHYRMGHGTFGYGLRLNLRLYSERRFKCAKKNSVPKRVGIPLWWLANGRSYRLVGEFIVGRITKYIYIYIAIYHGPLKSTSHGLTGYRA